MIALIYILIAVVIIGFGAALFYISRLQKHLAAPKSDDSMKMMAEWMKQIKEGSDLTRQEMQKSIDTTNKSINERLDNAARVIGTVSKELGQMQQIGKSLSYVQDF